jgi:hypothetical protein
MVPPLSLLSMPIICQKKSIDRILPVSKYVARLLQPAGESTQMKPREYYGDRPCLSPEIMAELLCRISEQRESLVTKFINTITALFNK